MNIVNNMKSIKLIFKLLNEIKTTLFKSDCSVKILS